MWCCRSAMSAACCGARGAASEVCERTLVPSAGVQLEPLTVYSNSTEMIHAEQMVKFNGGITLEPAVDGKPLQLMNATELTLKGALVVRNEAGDISYAWLDEVDPKSLKEVKFQAAEVDQLRSHWDAKPETATVNSKDDTAAATDTLWIGGILNELLSRTPLVPGPNAADRLHR